MKLFRSPPCPKCVSKKNTVLVKSPFNLLRVAVGFLLASILGDSLPLRWRCKSCEMDFSAVGDD